MSTQLACVPSLIRLMMCLTPPRCRTIKLIRGSSVDVLTLSEGNFMTRKLPLLLLFLGAVSTLLLSLISRESIETKSSTGWKGIRDDEKMQSHFNLMLPNLLSYVIIMQGRKRNIHLEKDVEKKRGKKGNNFVISSDTTFAHIRGNKKGFQCSCHAKWRVCNLDENLVYIPIQEKRNEQV